MFRSIVSTALLTSAALVAAPALAAPTQDIAYAKVAGNGSELYVVNSNGSGLTKVYSNKKGYVGYVEISPAGNELVFIERVSGSPSVLKRQRLKDSGTADGAAVTVPNLCGPDYADYNPADPGLLLVAGACSGHLYIATVRTDGSGYSELQTGNSNLYISQPRWLNDGASYVYVKSTQPNVQLLCRNGCDPNSGEVLWSGTQILWPDVARTSDTVIFTDNVGNIKVVDSSGNELSPPFASGRDAHFASDDSAIVYRSPHQASGDYVLIYDLATNRSTRLSAKGDWAAVDWRP
jgi:Tol biopolymer transport system component